MNDIENDILQKIQNSLDKTIGETLTGYNSPLTKLINEVVEKNIIPLKELINESISKLFTTDTFREEMVKQLHSKLTKVLINKTGGEIEKKVNELKQDATTRAKITLAIDKIIEEQLNNNEKCK